MIFPDEESVQDFANTPTSLQVICSYFEFECAKYSQQVEFLRSGETTAYLCVPSMHIVECVHACDETNKVFKRKDSEFTANLVDRKRMIVRIFSSSADEIENLI
jgi:hypothetical protein